MECQLIKRSTRATEATACATEEEQLAPNRWGGSSSALLRIMRSERQEVDRPIANLWTPLGRVRLGEMAGGDDVGLRPSSEWRGKLCDSHSANLSLGPPS
jgi:hypothetical protein